MKLAHHVKRLPHHVKRVVNLVLICLDLMIEEKREHINTDTVDRLVTIEEIIEKRSLF